MRTDYIINDCGVCLNPDILLEHKNKEIRFKVIAMPLENGKWSVASEIMASTWGYSGPVMPNTPWAVSTKEEGIRHEVTQFIKSLEHQLINLKDGEYDEKGNRIQPTQKVGLLHQAKEWAESQLGPKQLTFDF